MAIANLQETIQANILRRNQLNLEITELQTQKNLAAYSQMDVNSIMNSEKNAVRAHFKNLFETNENDYEDYEHYTEIPEYEEEIDRITAMFQEQLDELTAWETILDSQITTNSAELEEINAYLESYKSMLSTNIQEDFNFGLNG